MPERFDLLVHFGGILALFYLVLWFVAPRKWLYSLLLLLYAVVMVFVADGIRGRYGSSDLLYSALNASVSLACALLLLLLLVEGPVRLGMLPFVKTKEARSNAVDAYYWLIAGLVTPFVFLDSRVFARYPGTALLLALLVTVPCAFAVFSHFIDALPATIARCSSPAMRLGY